MEDPLAPNAGSAGRCTCTYGDGCDGEGYEPNDPRTCQVCRTLDGEADCPHDFDETLIPLLEQVTDTLTADGFETVVLATDGSEPIASMDLGDGYWLDLTANVRFVACPTSQRP